MNKKQTDKTEQFLSYHVVHFFFFFFGILWHYKSTYKIILKIIARWLFLVNYRCIHPLLFPWFLCAFYPNTLLPKKKIKKNKPSFGKGNETINSYFTTYRSASEHHSKLTAVSAVNFLLSAALEANFCRVMILSIIIANPIGDIEMSQNTRQHIDQQVLVR